MSKYIPIYNKDNILIGKFKSNNGTGIPYTNKDVLYHKEKGYITDPFPDKRDRYPYINVIREEYKKILRDPRMFKGTETRELTTFACLLPCYNMASIMHRAVASVFAQEHPFDEVILLCMTSEDTAKAKQLKETYPAIQIVESERLDVIKARNKLLEVSTADWITFLDPDDFLSENFLSSVVNSGIKAAAYYTAIHVGLQYTDYTQCEISDYEAHDNILSHNFTTVTHRDLYKEFFKDNEGIFFAEDTLFHVNILISKYKVATIRESYYWYNQHDSYFDYTRATDSVCGVSSSTDDALQMLVRFIQMFPDMFPYTADDIIKDTGLMITADNAFILVSAFDGALNRACAESMSRETSNVIDDTYINFCVPKAEAQNVCGCIADVFWYTYPDIIYSQDKFACLISPDATDIINLMNQHKYWEAFITSVCTKRCAFLSDRNTIGLVDDDTEITPEAIKVLDTYNKFTPAHYKIYKELTRKDRGAIYVTDSCDQHCAYCKQHTDCDAIPLNEEYIDTCLEALGIPEQGQIRLTGGEIGLLTDEQLALLSSKLKDYKLLIFTNGLLFKHANLKTLFPNASFVYHWVDWKTEDIPDYVPSYSAVSIVLTKEDADKNMQLLVERVTSVKNRIIDLGPCVSKPGDIYNIPKKDSQVLLQKLSKAFEGKAFVVSDKRSTEVKSCTDCSCRYYDYKTKKVTCMYANMYTFDSCIIGFGYKIIPLGWK